MQQVHLNPLPLTRCLRIKRTTIHDSATTVCLKINLEITVDVEFLKSRNCICLATSKAIPKARLEAIPWARFTVQAQAQLERDGALRQRRLGQLGTVDGAATPDVEEDADDAPEEKPAKEKE